MYYKISKIKLIYHIIFSKDFFSSALGGLSEVINYAINNFEEKRGDYSCDVLWFIEFGRLDKIKK